MTQDLSRLAATTQDYATFHACKSGLATALGGVLALLWFGVYLVLVPFCGVFARVGIRPATSTRIFLGGAFFFLPFLWLALKPLLARLLYQDLGQVRMHPEAAFERQRGGWVFGIAAAMLAWQTLVVLVLLHGIRGAMASGSFAAAGFQDGLPWFWVAFLPLAYALPAPLLLRGTEEARAYAALLGQALIWAAVGFSARLVHPSSLASQAWSVGFFLAQIGVLAWALVALRRGIREHRAYRDLLAGLPAAARP
jgi:hypothetical protein